MDSNMVGYLFFFLLLVLSHSQTRFVQTPTECQFSTQLAGLYAISKPRPDRCICAAFKNQCFHGLGKFTLSLNIQLHLRICSNGSEGQHRLTKFRKLLVSPTNVQYPTSARSLWPTISPDMLPPSSALNTWTSL